MRDSLFTDLGRAKHYKTGKLPTEIDEMSAPGAMLAS